MVTARTYSAPEVFHERFRLLNLCRVYFAAHDGTEWHFRPKLLAYSKRKRSLSGPRPSSKQHRATRHFLLLHEIDDQATSLRSCQLQLALSCSPLKIPLAQRPVQRNHHRVHRRVHLGP